MDMDLTTLIRVFVTVAGFICFLAIVLWAYGKPASAGFEIAAHQPIDDDDSTAGIAQATGVNFK